MAQAKKAAAKPETLNKKATSTKGAAATRKLADAVDRAARLKKAIASRSQEVKELQAELNEVEAMFEPVLAKADKATDVTIPGTVAKAVAAKVSMTTTIDHEAITRYLMKKDPEVLVSLGTYTVKDAEAYLSPDLLAKYVTKARGDRKRTIKYIDNVDA